MLISAFFHIEKLRISVLNERLTVLHCIHEISETTHTVIKSQRETALQSKLLSFSVLKASSLICRNLFIR